MIAPLVLNIFKFSSSRHIKNYQGVYLAKKRLYSIGIGTYLPGWSDLKDMHQEMIDNIINGITLQLVLQSVLEV